MKQIELSFCRIELHEKDLAEITVAEGVELNERMVDHLHLALVSNLKAPYRLLVNKSNDYSYSFGAQYRLGNLRGVELAAVVVKNEASAKVVKMIKKLGNSYVNYHICFCREEALNWLHQPCSQPHQ